MNSDDEDAEVVRSHRALCSSKQTLRKIGRGRGVSQEGGGREVRERLTSRSIVYAEGVTKADATRLMELRTYCLSPGIFNALIEPSPDLYARARFSFHTQRRQS